jgi:hypothetical protein
MRDKGQVWGHMVIMCGLGGLDFLRSDSILKELIHFDNLDLDYLSFYYFLF